MSLDETTSTGPSDPDVPAPSGSEAADPIRHVGGPWYEVDTDTGVERVRGRQAAEQLAAGTGLSTEPQNASEAVGSVDVTKVDDPHNVMATTLRGPAVSFDLPNVPSGPVVAEGHRGPVDVTVDGTTVRRTSGHFGRGYWTFTYPA